MNGRLENKQKGRKIMRDTYIFISTYPNILSYLLVRIIFLIPSLATRSQSCCIIYQFFKVINIFSFGCFFPNLLDCVHGVHVSNFFIQENIFASINNVFISV